MTVPANVIELHPDQPMHPDARRNALAWIRFLVRFGLAGDDQYADGEFIVDPRLRDTVDDALDTLGATFLTDRGGKGPVRCLLPVRVRRQLGLDDADAPVLVVPLASRGVG